MQFLMIILCANIGFWSVWFFLKLVWEPGNTEHLKMQAQIRTLEWKKRQLDAGVNPDGMPFDYDHSSGYHNYNCGCEQCKRIGPENEARIKRDAIKVKELLHE